MSKIEDQVTDLLSALQLQPRKAWADEVSIPVVLGGRCGGSYGCSVPIPEANIPRKEMQPRGDVIGDLAELVAAGVNVENAAAALARKYESEPALEKGLLNLIEVMRNPKSQKANFQSAIKALYVKGSRGNMNDVLNAIDEGRFDEI